VRSAASIEWRAEHALCWHRIHMMLFARSTGRVADIVGRVFNRFAAVIIGVVLMVIGLGMMATIVMLPVVVVLELAGVLIFVGGLFGPDDRAVRQGDER
jgi:predicted PurR-regulated permease PerM